MKHGKIKIFTGTGRGKTPAALGLALQTAAQGGQVTIIQFLKGRGLGESEFVKRLEPEIKLFRFEKAEDCFDDLSEEEKKEAIMNIKNGLGFARKVLSTGECDLLVLDEVLGLVDNKIITVDELKEILAARSESTTIVLTGITLSDDICMLADEVSKLETVKMKKWEDM